LPTGAQDAILPHDPCMRHAVAEVSYSVEACANEEETRRSGI